MVEPAASHALLDALDEDGVLGADLAVELEHVVDPRLVDVRADEVVEEAGRALRRRWAGPARSRGSDARA